MNMSRYSRLLERMNHYLENAHVMRETDLVRENLALREELYYACESVKAQREEVLRSEGWWPVKEYLENWSCDPTMMVLMHIDRNLHSQCTEVLEGYQDSTAFFNPETDDLYEACGWGGLWTMTHDDEPEP